LLKYYICLSLYYILSIKKQLFMSISLSNLLQLLRILGYFEFSFRKLLGKSKNWSNKGIRQQHTICCRDETHVDITAFTRKSVYKKKLKKHTHCCKTNTFFVLLGI